MTNWREILKASDPVLSEPALNADAAREMRALVVDAEANGRRRRVRALPVALAAALVGVAIAGTAAIERSNAAVDTRPVAGEVTTARDVRQLQFATPGGTRVFWVFDVSKESR
jgi:hypothetical protein